MAMEKCIFNFDGTNRLKSAGFILIQEKRVEIANVLKMDKALEGNLPSSYIRELTWSRISPEVARTNPGFWHGLRRLNASRGSFSKVKEITLKRRPSCSFQSIEILSSVFFEVDDAPEE